MAQRKETAVQVHKDLPAFIVGLPDDLLEADLAKSKFADTVSFLKKMAPEIEEARCKMKIVHGTSKKSRYEVDVRVITPYSKHTYSDSGWNLAKIFDVMGESLKKRFVQEKHTRRKTLRRV